MKILFLSLINSQSIKIYSPPECNCPYGLCEEVTGECICPTRVEGDRCDKCEPEAYGYDALIGCQVGHGWNHGLVITFVDLLFKTGLYVGLILYTMDC